MDNVNRGRPTSAAQSNAVNPYLVTALMNHTRSNLLREVKR
jgi:hypothetical protein